MVSSHFALDSSAIRLSTRLGFKWWLYFNGPPLGLPLDSTTVCSVVGLLEHSQALLAKPLLTFQLSVRWATLSRMFNQQNGQSLGASHRLPRRTGKSETTERRPQCIANTSSQTSASRPDSFSDSKPARALLSEQFQSIFQGAAFSLLELLFQKNNLERLFPS